MPEWDEQNKSQSPVLNCIRILSHSSCTCPCQLGGNLWPIPTLGQSCTRTFCYLSMFLERWIGCSFPDIGPLLFQNQLSIIHWVCVKCLVSRMLVTVNTAMCVIISICLMHVSALMRGTEMQIFSYGAIDHCKNWTERSDINSSHY